MMIDYKYSTKHKTPVKVICCLLTIFLLSLLCACGSDQAGSSSAESSSADNDSHYLTEEQTAGDRTISQFLSFESETAPEYAKGFRFFHYQDDYTLLHICDDSRFLIVPEGKSAPEDLDPDITVLHRPVQNIYLAGTACMDMFVKIDALDCISLSGAETEKWYISEARDAMEKGEILYAGKYNAPDYELILSKGCELAVENTMILHIPEVREQLAELNVPVLVDHSSYESHPFGRMEWVKVYGVLTGQEEKADTAFHQQIDACRSAVSSKDTGRSIAFFAVTASGAVTVRKSTDYVPEMIRMAGGTYLPDDLSDGSITSTTTIQMEEFCRLAQKADCLIYNGAIQGEITSLQELLTKAPALKTFKAVQNGRVWYTAQNLYQSSMETGTIITDFHEILTNPDGSGSRLHYFDKLKS